MRKWVREEAAKRGTHSTIRWAHNHTGHTGHTTTAGTGGTMAQPHWAQVAQRHTTDEVGTSGTLE